MSSSSAHQLHDEHEEPSQSPTVTSPRHPTSPEHRSHRHGSRASHPHSDSTGTPSSSRANGSLSAEPVSSRPLNGGSHQKPKRRRLDAELEFSSPGPAFAITSISVGDDAGTSSGTESAGPSRSLRARRSLGQGGRDGKPNHSPKPFNVSQQYSSKKKRLSNAQLKDRRSRSISTSESEREALASSCDDPPTRLSPASRQPVNENGNKASFDTADQSQNEAEDEAEAEAEEPLAQRRRLPTITPVSAFDSAMAFSEILKRRKDEKIQLAQAQLEDVHEDHDTMVRELFHLTKFVTLIGYDPAIAKQDRSDVFSQFQQAHDLRFALQAPEAESSGSTGRITRRGMNARLEGLSLKRLQPPTRSPAPATGRSESSKSRKLSSSVQDENTSGSEKGKRRATETDIRKRPKAGSELEASEHIDTVDSMTESPSVSRTKRTASRRKSSHISDSELLEQYHAMKRLRPLPKVPPPLRATAPQHIPPPPTFGGSLSRFFDSYRVVDGDEVSHSHADQLEAAEIQTNLRIDRKRRQGLALNEALVKMAKLPAHAAARNRDHRDHLLDAMTQAAQSMRQVHKQKMQITKRIARMVSVHWERQLGSSERERRAEEKRVRALAKWTVREVAKQWKLAVNVIRARKAAAEKAQKEKLDKEQLNAIIEKSTKMLQQQHAEMTRFEAVSDSERSIYDTESDVYSMEDDEPEEDEEEPEAGDDDQGGLAEETMDHPADESGPARAAGGVADAEIFVEDSEMKETLSASATPQRSRTASATPSLVPSASGKDEDQDGTAAGAGQEHREASVSAAEEAAESRATIRRSSRAASRRIMAKKAGIKPDPDLADDEFADVDESLAVEDEELERKMWEDDEEDESEDAGLAADADIPIEELLRRYGYKADGSTDTKESADGAGEAVSDNSEEESIIDNDASTEPSDAGQDEQSMQDGELPLANDTPAAEKQAEKIDANQDDAETASSLVHQDEESVDDMSEDDSAVERLKRNSRRSLTRASSALSSDRAAARARQPFLLRGQLRPYQQFGFEWLSGLYANNVNGILADEMGLGKTIQTISLLAHLACDKGVWGPHLVVAPTSVMLNWEVEFKKFLPGFKILSYYGNQRERKEKRVGWNTENSFNVCITSYQLVLADQHIFRRKPWVYLILDEAHHIKNFRSQRWQTLLGFNSQRRLLLTGTPLQNNLMDLWSLMYFLMPQGVADIPGGGAFANMKDFQDWFSNPIDKAIESGQTMNDEMREMIGKLHTVLRPFLLRRLKSEVEKELPRKYEHVITCRLSKRQRFLYNDFMSRAKTRESLASGNYLSIINCLMQLRKVCNHPDLFEVRPIVTSFAMQRSAVADYEIKELLVRRQLLREDPLNMVDLDAVNLRVTSNEQHLTAIHSRDLRRLNASRRLPFFKDPIPTAPQLDTWTLDGFRKTLTKRRHIDEMSKWKHFAYVNQYRCTRRPVYGAGLISEVRQLVDHQRLLPEELVEPDRRGFLDRCDNLHQMVLSRKSRREAMQSVIDRYAFATPRAVAVDMPRFALPGLEPYKSPEMLDQSFDTVHPVAVKLHIAFPDASLLQYDCGKLQQLDVLMRRLKEGGHRILIFTQMTRVLDILESFLNYHGYRYLRLDGATKVEQRQALTEKFNRDLRISAFILSTRSGGLGINLTGADTVLFYDLDWNAAIESQCMDRAHRIGQTRDVHIYRFVSEHTIEENMLRKANQKRQLDSMVIQDGEFTTDQLLRNDWRDMLDDGGTLAGVHIGTDSTGATEPRDVERALLAAEDEEDAAAARAARAEMFTDDTDFAPEHKAPPPSGEDQPASVVLGEEAEAEEGEEEEEEGTIDDYMLRFVEADWEFFA